MFLQFIMGLFVLTVAFVLVVKLILLVIGVLFFAAESAGGSESEDGIVHPRSFLFNKVVLSVVYSAFIAILTSHYASRPGVRYSWLYAVTGFFATFFVLGSDASEQRKAAEDIFSGSTETDSAIARGAAIGFFTGLVIFPIFYKWPGIAFFIPGTEMLFDWVLRFANWLTGFWIVRGFLALSLVGVLFNFGFMALMSAVMLGLLAWGGIRSLFKRLNGGDSSG